MKHATYTGPLVHLRGMTAEVIAVGDSGEVKAQFDDVAATRSGKPLTEDSEQNDTLGFGWHSFAAEDFA